MRTGSSSETESIASALAMSSSSISSTVSKSLSPSLTSIPISRKTWKIRSRWSGSTSISGKAARMSSGVRYPWSLPLMISASAAETSRSAPEGGGRVAARDLVAVLVAAVISTLSYAGQAGALDCKVRRTIGTTTAFTIIAKAVCVCQFGRSDREIPRGQEEDGGSPGCRSNMRGPSRAATIGCRSANRDRPAQMRRICGEPAELGRERVRVLGTALVPGTVHLGRDAHQRAAHALLVDKPDAVGHELPDCLRLSRVGELGN